MLMIRRGGNVGPEEEAIRSQQGQWPHPQVIINIIIKIIIINIIIIFINKTNITKTIIIIVSLSLTLNSNSEFPLCCPWYNPWHVQVYKSNHNAYDDDDDDDNDDDDDESGINPMHSDVYFMSTWCA